MAQPRNESDPNAARSGEAERPTEGKGHPKPAQSRAFAEDSPREGTTSATVAKAEQEEAAAKGADKTQEGRGRRKD